MATQDVIQALVERFPEAEIEARPLNPSLQESARTQWWVRIAPEQLIETCAFLRSDQRCRMEQLCDVTCVDYLNYPDADDRFGVIYSLLSLSHNHRLWLKVFVNDPNPVVPSVTDIWKGANWPEREVFDMFGIVFANHPDLRRILCPDDFEDHPLRKDYPLRGRGERERFMVLDRDSA